MEATITDYFKILGIQPTKDIREIKQAYSTLLKVYHPEEFPEQFKELHEAYEKALEYAKNAVETISYNSNPRDFYLPEQENIVENEITNKFKNIDEKAENYDKEQKEIDDLMQMLRLEKATYNSVPFWFFDEPLFKKHCHDERFLNAYIQMIEMNGIYERTPYFKRMKYLQVHQKYYSKKEYSKLYKALEPYLCMYFSLIIEEICLICTYLYGAKVGLNTPHYQKMGVLLFILAAYPVFMKRQKFTVSKKDLLITRCFVWASFLAFILLGVTYKG